MWFRIKAIADKRKVHSAAKRKHSKIATEKSDAAAVKKAVAAAPASAVAAITTDAASPAAEAANAGKILYMSLFIRFNLYEFV